MSAPATPNAVTARMAYRRAFEAYERCDWGSAQELNVVAFRAAIEAALADGAAPTEQPRPAASSPPDGVVSEAEVEALAQILAYEHVPHEERVYYSWESATDPSWKKASRDKARRYLEAAARVRAAQGLGAEAQPVADGWLFLNPDTGPEWSENHPIDSGECDNAECVRPATLAALREELREAWFSLAEDREEREWSGKRPATPTPPPTDLEAVRREARADMRERCAKVADAQVENDKARRESGEISVEGAGLCILTGLLIAMDIRALPDEASR